MCEIKLLIKWISKFITLGLNSNHVNKRGRAHPGMSRMCCCWLSTLVESESEIVYSIYIHGIHFQVKCIIHTQTNTQTTSFVCKHDCNPTEYYCSLDNSRSVPRITHGRHPIARNWVQDIGRLQSLQSDSKKIKVVLLYETSCFIKPRYIDYDNSYIRLESFRSLEVYKYIVDDWNMKCIPFTMVQAYFVRRYLLRLICR